jgi:peptide/nickel transport system permease protein
MLGIAVVAALLLELMPGDPAVAMAGEAATPERVQMIRTEVGLDKPLWERFGSYLWGVVQGDLGSSPRTGTAVWDQMSATLPVTLSLGALAMFLAVLLGVGSGTLAALRRGQLADRAVTAMAAMMQAIPPFVVGLGLVVFLAVDRSWFPATGYVPLTQDPGLWLRHVLLPAFTLALTPAAELARQTRGALVDTLEQDYIRGVRAKGLSEAKVVCKHGAKNAATPVVTVLGMQVGRVLGGAVVVELIFGMPGFGALALNAVMTRDVVLIQGVILISALAVLLSNFVVDVSYGFFNPKVRG